jgi:pilus assembly protein Flp/PilA
VLEKGGLMIGLLAKLLVDDRGVTAVEYGLIAALISVAIVSVLTTVGLHLSTTFNTVATRL